MQQAKWIWYEGDFELHHHMKLCLSRRERGNLVPSFWKIYDCHRLIRFEKKVTLTQPETIRVQMDGEGYMMLGFRRTACSGSVRLEAGEYVLAFVVGNATGIPALCVEGETLCSDETWLADAMEGEKCAVGAMALPEGMTPSGFGLPTEPINYASAWAVDHGMMYDFGRETYIQLKFDMPQSGCPVRVVYGESVEEAMSDEHAVIREELPLASGTVTLPATACRFVRIVSEIAPQNVCGLYEALPLKKQGSFECSDALINRIYDISEYTLHLNSRLFYLDGIKRDGWVWGGDAYQSYFCNYYCHYDQAIIKRTMLALRGGDPIASHINGIVDYSLYWLISLDDYCLYMGDHAFVRRMYGRAERLMDYCEGRENAHGLLQGRPGDWTFIDWADMEKNGALCCMQMLYCRALESMAKCAALAENKPASARYAEKAKVLRDKIKDIYWNETLGAYVTTFDQGIASSQIRRHANIFALIFGFADRDMAEKIIQNVILNDEVPAISTPYFKFYELEALCKAGRMTDVTEILRSYWGGMLDEGATTFWEEYDPRMKGVEHYAMYREPFDKSLCHAWGASPLYLLGRYYLGVSPLQDGYGTYEVRPALGGLDRIEGTVPLKDGSVRVCVEDGFVTIKTDVSGGWYILGNEKLPIEPDRENRFPYDRSSAPV